MAFTEKDEIRANIICLFQEKYSMRKIASALSIGLSTVNSVIQKYRIYGSTDRIKGSGRKKSLDSDDIQLIRNEVAVNNKVFAKNIAKNIKNERKKDVSQWTVSRELRNLGLFSRVPTYKPLLTSFHREARLRLATVWSRWPIKKFRSVIFSDECRFELYGNDGRQKIRRIANSRYDSVNISGTKKYGGGGVMFWGCISYHGVGKLAAITRTMDSVHYTTILARNLHASAEIMGLESGFIFQQDNASCHKSAYTCEFFKENKIDVLEWPAQSPDLNPIENLWDYVKVQLRKRVIKNSKDLIGQVTEIWENIPTSMLHKLIDSMPSRLEEVIRARGGNTRY